MALRGCCATEDAKIRGPDRPLLGPPHPLEASVHRVPKRLLSGVVPYMEAHLVRRVGEAHPRLEVGEPERAAGAYGAERPLAAAEAEDLGGPVEAQGVGHRGLHDLVAGAQ